MIREIAQRWPGKSAGEDGIEHPAIYHMLDVAAVAESLAAALDMDSRLRQALVFLVALHDLGKINAAFRAMLRQGTPQAQGLHWEVTEALLWHHDDLLASRLGGCERHRKALYAATAGHHGRPPTKDPGGTEWRRMLRAAGEEAVADGRVVIDALLELWPGASLAMLEKAETAALSWRLAGLVTAADWIASNPSWFPPCAPGPSLRDYLADRREKAAGALGLAGLGTPDVTDTNLFDLDLRPLQEAVATTPIPDGPMLAVLEDETGSGKTEAALILAQRMMRAGKGRGLYFGLPTMATADAMFARVAEMLRRLYAGAPSLALAHGRAELSERFRDIAQARARNPDEPGPTDWFLDNRRRALLADVGVGTIDQALLAVVRARHAALRQFGLSRKILIVDEVHEMGDPYMGRLLESLLHAHAALGGSAILLSATLPLDLRQRLVAAFEEGAGRKSPETRESRAYPALTVPRAAAPAVVARPSPRGPLHVARLSQLEEALDQLAEAAERGAACVLIRNAVDEAMAAFERLAARGVPADLLHARFALCDRKRHEARVLRTFGKDRAPRPGRVLVATQVVEASLDLDFDVMVSDLAPMAALIQRAGRMWRHMDARPAKARPVPAPVLQVIAPDPQCVTGAHWAQEALGRGAFVYPIADLWRTARVLFDVGRIVAPEGLRDLVERAEAPDLPVPEALLAAEIRAEGQGRAARSHAAHNTIAWAKGYRAGAAGAEDSDYPTRLGQPQQPLILAHREGRALAPWSGGDWSVESCQLSEVQASRARLSRLDLPDQQAPEIAAIRARLPRWLVESRVICPVGADGGITLGLAYKPERGLLVCSDPG